MASMTREIPVSEISKMITFKIIIVGFKGWKIRLKIAKLLFKIAAFVAGTQIQILES